MSQKTYSQTALSGTQQEFMHWIYRHRKREFDSKEAAAFLGISEEELKSLLLELQLQDLIRIQIAFRWTRKGNQAMGLP